VGAIVFGWVFAVLMCRAFVGMPVFTALWLVVPIAANQVRPLVMLVLTFLEGIAAAVEADHVLYGWFFFTLVIIILIAIGMTFAQKIDRRIPVHSTGWSKPPGWRFAVAIPAAILLAVAGPAYAARLNALYPPAPLADAPG